MKSKCENIDNIHCVLQQRGIELFCTKPINCWPIWIFFCCWKQCWSFYKINIILLAISLKPRCTTVWNKYSLLHFLLSHMAVHHHLHHLYYDHLHHLLLVQSSILNLRLGSSANHFLHGPFPLLLDWFHGLSGHLIFLFCSTAGFVYMVC